MKTAGTIVVALGVLSIAASPALAGKKKSKKKRPAAEEAAPRRLCDELGLGITLASRTGEAAAPKKQVDLEEALVQAESFDLSRLDRRSSMPTGDGAIRIEAQALTDAQVGQVVKGRRGDLEFCWSRLPAAERDLGTITLKLTIEPKGTVSALEVGGAPAAMTSCLAVASKRWVFPVADTRSDVEYPVVLNDR